MSVKYRNSETIRTKNAGMQTNHYYVKQLPKDKLFEMINDTRVKPKVKRKLILELNRRKIKWQYVPIKSQQ